MVSANQARIAILVLMIAILVPDSHAETGYVKQEMGKTASPVLRIVGVNNRANLLGDFAAGMEMGKILFLVVSQFVILLASPVQTFQPRLPVVAIITVVELKIVLIVK